MALNMTKEEWTQQLDAAISKLNETKGQVKDAPLAGITPASPCAMPLCNRVITEDMIRLFACAIGDPNPLWLDNDYAKDTRWGGVIMPPMGEVMIAECAPTPDPIPLPGLVYLNGGSTRIYHDVIRPRDEFKGVDTFLGIVEKSNPDKPYRLFIQRGQRDFINQKGEKVITVTSNIMIKAMYPGDRTGPKKVRDFSDVKRRMFTPEELAMVHQSYDDELSGKARYGKGIRDWNSVNEGDELGVLYKGPYDNCDAVSFFGVTGWSYAFAIKWNALKPIEKTLYRDPETGEVHHGADWHFLDHQARNNGVPFSPVFGSHIECCMVQLASNWKGDDAKIKQVSSQIRKMAYMGDILVIKGKVARKYEENGEKLVDLELWAERYGTDEVTSTGKVTVQL